MENEKKTRKWNTLDITLIGLMAAVIAVCSWISIPLTIPFTMQTFAVFLAVLVLGGKKGTVSVLIYIALGAVGVPVFAGFKGGIGSLLGPTGGYIFGFVFISILMIITNHFTNKWYFELIACIAGLILCYTFGTIWFLYVMDAKGKTYDLATALGACVFPFILPDVLKLGLSMTIGKQLRRLQFLK